MSKDDAVRRVDVERLGLGVRGRARRRIPGCWGRSILSTPVTVCPARRGERTVSDAHSADELAQALGVEEVADHAIALALVEATFRSAGDDAACVLASDREASIVPVGAGVGVGERRHAGGGNRADRSRVLCQLGVDIERSHREQSRSGIGRKRTDPRCWRSWRPSASSGATLFWDARRIARIPPAGAPSKRKRQIAKLSRSLGRAV